MPLAGGLRERRLLRARWYRHDSFGALHYRADADRVGNWTTVALDSGPSRRWSRRTPRPIPAEPRRGRGGFGDFPPASAISPNGSPAHIRHVPVTRYCGRVCGASPTSSTSLLGMRGIGADCARRRTRALSTRGRTVTTERGDHNDVVLRHRRQAGGVPTDSRHYFLESRGRRRVLPRADGGSVRAPACPGSRCRSRSL